MKGMDIFCASQAATAICLSMDQASPSSNLLLGGSSPAIDRHNPIIRDSRRNAAAAPLPSLTPKLQKNRLKKKNAKLPPPPPLPLKQNDDDKEINIEISSKNGNASSSSSSSSSGVSRKSWSCTKPGDFISPPGSTRYLLSEKVLLNALSDFDPPLKLFPAETSKGKDVNTNDAKAKPPPSSASPDQVVVLRVSLHCRGCERKMRKHISRMEGVRSFNIDFAAKKVTVTGDVTPLEVLSSISKVKNAQLWPPTISSEFNNTAAAAAAAAAAWVTDKGSFVGMASSS